MAGTATQMLERANRDALKSTKRKKCAICEDMQERKDIIKSFDPRVRIPTEDTPTMWCCDDCFDEYQVFDWE